MGEPERERLQRVISGALKDQINQHGPITQEARGSAAKRAAHQVYPCIEELQAENTDLHLVAQGIKHYWLCPEHFAAPKNSPHYCLRCQGETKSTRIEVLEEALAGLILVEVSPCNSEAWQSRENAKRALVGEKKRTRHTATCSSWCGAALFNPARCDCGLTRKAVE